MNNEEPFLCNSLKGSSIIFPEGYIQSSSLLTNNAMPNEIQSADLYAATQLIPSYLLPNSREI